MRIRRDLYGKDIKAVVLDVEGAPEMHEDLGFMPGIPHPALIKGEVAHSVIVGKKAPAVGNQKKETRQISNGFKNKQMVRIGSQIGEEDGPEDMIIEAEIGGHLYTDIRGWRSVLRSSIRTLLRQAPARNKKPDDSQLNINSRFSGRKKHFGDMPEIPTSKDRLDKAFHSAWMNFMVIRSPSQHNGIIGRTGIRKIRAVPSTAHEMLKFPVKGGTVTIRSSRVIPMECAMNLDS
ncbi:hypothetical protein Tco_0383527 [Tanacetum coccineum]